jgi:GNAT superfamily N-acetyltransferase
MSQYAIRALDATTWEAWARLAEKHKGMGFGGCWCTSFHSRVGRREGEKGRPWKERLVREGNAHAAVVFDGDDAVAWCQYGSPEELPNIQHVKQYEATRTDELPDYRITCIFVDRDYRRKGVAGVALRGALDLIAEAGGGVVEGYPQDTQGKKNVRLAGLSERHKRPEQATSARQGSASQPPLHAHRVATTACFARTRARVGFSLEPRGPATHDGRRPVYSSPSQ